WRSPLSTLFPYTTLFRSNTGETHAYVFPRVGDLEGWLAHWQAVVFFDRDFVAERFQFVQKLAHFAGHLAVVQRCDNLDGLLHARSEEHTSELQSRENLVC